MLSSGKDTDALQISPQELMLQLVEKYSYFMYPPKAHGNGTNSYATDTPGKVVRNDIAPLPPRSTFDPCHCYFFRFRSS